MVALGLFLVTIIFVLGIVILLGTKRIFLSSNNLSRQSTEEDRQATSEDSYQSTQLTAETMQLVELDRQERLRSEGAQRVTEESLQEVQRERQEAERPDNETAFLVEQANQEHHQAVAQYEKAEETSAEAKGMESADADSNAMEQSDIDGMKMRPSDEGDSSSTVFQLAQAAEEDAGFPESQGAVHQTVAIEIQPRLVKRPPQRLERDQREALQGQPRVQGAKPEILCWQTERQWILAVELPDEIRETDNIQVLQDQQTLEKEQLRNNSWRLRQGFGEVVVFVAGREFCRYSIDEQNKGYLLFRLTGETQRQGRVVEQPSSGAYLFVVPTTWRPESAGSPEDTSLDGYIGYYRVFDKDVRSKFSFDIPGKQPITIQSKADQFVLIGNNLNDASEYVGPLFGRELPVIHGLSDEAWNKISTVVVGEEGRAKGAWRTSFTPVVEGTNARLLEEKFADRRVGWYFIRFYNNENTLVESLDFRYVKGLQSIAINPYAPLPSDTGHSIAIIEFNHDESCQIHSAGDVVGELISESWGHGTRVLIPANPRWDKTKWLVVPKNGEERQRVEVTVQIERIWWAIGKEDKMPTEWTDKPVTLAHDDFRATSEKILWLLLPRPRWADHVRIGFAQTELHQCQTRVTENVLAKPLRDFESAPQLRKPGLYILEAQFDSHGVEYAQSLCDVAIQMQCKHCDFHTFDLHSLLSHVKTSHLNDIFTSPTYQDIRAHDSNIPYAIFKCFYCDKYVPVDDPRNKTDLMYGHSKICEEAPKLGGIGPREKHFVPVTDIDEIQHVIGLNLTKMRKCKLCDGFLLDKHSAEEEMKHLIEKHQNALYENH